MGSSKSSSSQLLQVDPLAAAASAAADSATGLSLRRVDSIEPSTSFSLPAAPVLPPPATDAAIFAPGPPSHQTDSGDACNASTRTRREARLLAEVNAISGVEELKMKIRQVAATRRERLQTCAA